MAIIGNTYGGIITKGMGVPACCGLITMGFSVFKCTFRFIPPNQNSKGGGGGSKFMAPFQPVHPSIYTPLSPITENYSAQIRIDLRIKHMNPIQKAFMVAPKTTNQIIKVQNIISGIMLKARMRAINIRKTFAKVKTIFKI